MRYQGKRASLLPRIRWQSISPRRYMTGPARSISTRDNTAPISRDHAPRRNEPRGQPRTVTGIVTGHPLNADTMSLTYNVRDLAHNTTTIYQFRAAGANYDLTRQDSLGHAQTQRWTYQPAGRTPNAANVCHAEATTWFTRNGKPGHVTGYMQHYGMKRVTKLQRDDLPDTIARIVVTALIPAMRPVFTSPRTSRYR
jgi:hypothetical protein